MLLTKDDMRREFTDPEELARYINDLELVSKAPMDNSQPMQPETTTKADTAGQKKEWAALFRENPRRARNASREGRRNRSV